VPFLSQLVKGQRSEQAVKLAIAEVHVQRVTRRNATAVMEEMCGLEVTDTQFNRALHALDAELIAWPERP
jgi:transposase-like protein